MFNQFVKDPCEGPPKRSRWIEAQTCIGVSSNLSALTELCNFLHPSAFLREPSKHIELYSLCQPFIFLIFLSMRARAIRSALRKISNNNQQYLPEPLGFAGDKLLGHAMDCSLWDSLQRLRGSCLTCSNELVPLLGFPLPSLGAGHQATGRLYCSFFATFKE